MAKLTKRQIRTIQAKADYDQFKATIEKDSFAPLPFSHERRQAAVAASVKVENLPEQVREGAKELLEEWAELYGVDRPE